MKIDKHILIDIILAIALSIMLFITLRSNKPQELKPSDSTKPDTVYVDKPYKSIPEYKFISVPTLVTFYKTDTIRVDSVKVDSKDIHLYSGKISHDFSISFLSNHPEANKLVQFTTKKGQLNITQVNHEGITYSQSYAFYPDIYNYNYQDNSLSYRKKPFFQRFYGSSELMYRPLNDLWDFNLGIGYKTRKINYEIGLNTHYYPIFQSTLGFDPYFRVRLTF